MKIERTEGKFPERVGVEDGKHFPCLIDPDAKMSLGLAGPTVVREAAARYNAVERLMRMEAFRADDLPGDTLHNILDEERELLGKEVAP